ncbi:C40 family peptidase [Noviherbaspirillum autotrophicum]|uniref:C40 family peptidase n=1 Tax=Noviherbaspirillum autotrophicum TaxID=709839 RepID=UPI000694DFC9|nr:C40 family peptidase [Noviherbaspirillum autotrophicum]
MRCVTFLLVCCLVGSAHSADLSSSEAGTDQPAADMSGPTYEVTARALALVGSKYRFGGMSPRRGFDCSGLVDYVFHDTAAQELPRTAAGISQVGKKVDIDQLQPGDLVFFNTLRRAFSHVGIYLGGNKFIHAPRSGAKVRVEALDLAYWKNRFNGARRILSFKPPTQLANVDDRVTMYLF